jgi:hypothetical protein
LGAGVLPLLGLLLACKRDAPSGKTTVAADDLGSVVEPPPGPVIRNLMELWSRQIGR